MKKKTYSGIFTKYIPIAISTIALLLSVVAIIRADNSYNEAVDHYNRVVSEASKQGSSDASHDITNTDVQYDEDDWLVKINEDTDISGLIPGDVCRVCKIQYTPNHEVDCLYVQPTGQNTLYKLLPDQYTIYSESFKDHLNS